MVAKHAGYEQFVSLPVLTSETDYSGVVARLEHILNSASVAQLQDGATWYTTAHSLLATAAHKANLPIELVAYAASALSAQTGWQRNVQALAAHIVAYCSGDTEAPHTQGYGTVFHRNDKKAWAILHAASPEAGYALLGQGEKTLAFGPNLLEQDCLPNGNPAVTVDSIMYQAAYGRVTAKISKDAYNTVRRACLFLAKKYGYTWYQIQAIVWVVWRGTAN